ncbi:hypothetical protein ZWY2020_057986 [Hordeum vulgare]|nr:hypothetical protein ZWY2020_057986 [Hordeum vulgare]
MLFPTPARRRNLILTKGASTGKRGHGRGLAPRPKALREIRQSHKSLWPCRRRLWAALQSPLTCLPCSLSPAWLTAVPAIYKSREVGRRSPLPNIAAVLSCCVALLYGCSRRDGLVIGVNVAGAVMQAGYVGVFVYFSPA